MNAQEIHASIARAEQFADQAKAAAQSADADLRQAIMALHQEASQAKKAGVKDEATLRQMVLQVESTADRALEACRNAGQVDASLQEAVKGAHAELSRLKKQLESGAPA